MAGRFPGANSVSTFWSNLRRGKESIVTLSEQELLRRRGQRKGSGESGVCAARPAPRRDRRIRRRLLRFPAAGRADAGSATPVVPAVRVACARGRRLRPRRFDGSIGVYGTSSPSGYLLHNLLSHRDPNVVIGARDSTSSMVSLSLQNDKDFLATRVSHQFNLRGPSIAVQTACSSSLVAVHLACHEPAARRMRHGTGRRCRRCASRTASVTGTSPDRWCRRSATAGRSTSEPTARSSAAVSRWWSSNRCRPPSTTGTAFTPSSADRRSTTTDRRRWATRRPIRPLRPMSSPRRMRWPASIRRP